MRVAALKELAASAAARAFSSSSSADTTVESLSSLFVSALKNSSSSPSSPVPAKRKPEALRVAELIATRKKTLASAPFGSSPPNSADSGAAGKPSKPPVRLSSKALVLKQGSCGEVGKTPGDCGDKSAIDVVFHITSALQGETGSLEVPQSEESNNDRLIENNLPNTHNIFQSHMRKERARERKARWTNKNTQDHRFSQLIKRSAEALGTEGTLEVLGKLGKETGIKEYNALIGLCIEKARRSIDEDDSLAQLQKAFQLFRSMKEQGFRIEEETYCPLLIYLIEMEMIQEFQNISEMIKDENPESSSRICYYEMLLWVRIGDEEKIQDVCNSLRVDDTDLSFHLAENYLLAFCESDRKEEIVDFLEFLDIRRISSREYLSVIFKSVGKLSLEDVAMKLILALKGEDARREDISSLIFDYTSNIPNLVVEEVVSKFIHLHDKFEVAPSSQSYSKIIIFCCNSLKVHVTLDPILRGTEHICEQYWVCELCSMLRRHQLKLDKESSKSMMSLYLMMKDFEGAHNLLAELKEMNMEVDTSTYNALLIGYFREKNIGGGLLVLEKMMNNNVKPDSETFSYLIFNCGCEEEISKCLEEMKHFQVDFTKQIYVALVNAYANCGKFDQAKQVIMDKCVPVEYINEIRSALVSAFSSNGKISDALEMYDAMKQAGCRVEPKAIVNLIEFFPSEGQNRLLHLLAELDNSPFWFEACGRIALYFIRNNLLSSAVDLLKKLKEKDESGTYTFIDQMFSQIWETEPTNMEIGMALLRAVKDDLGLHPSRTSLDFLLSACVKKKDLKSARSIWAEYSKVGLPFNILTYLRIYHALLASGDFSGAEKILKKIPQVDKHVRDIVKACKVAYANAPLPSGE